jgi:hypothetical protein
MNLEFFVWQVTSQILTVQENIHSTCKVYKSRTDANVCQYMRFEVLMVVIITAMTIFGLV